MFKKKVTFSLFQPFKRPKFLFWFFLICFIVLTLAALIAPSTLGVWALAAASLGITIFIKLFYINSMPELSDEVLIDFFGLPGSGKSFFMAREVYKAKRKKNFKVCCNRNFSHFNCADFICTRSDLGHKDLGQGTVLVWDEGNLAGFDNRDYASNFKDNARLEFFLKHRQNGNPIVMNQQSFGSLDKRIRDITYVYYFCRNHGWFCSAQRISIDMQLDPLTSEPVTFYVAARPIDAIFQRDAWLFGLPKLQGSHLYKTSVRSTFDNGSFLDTLNK